jgi:hypothetical protein
MKNKTFFITTAILFAIMAVVSYIAVYAILFVLHLMFKII